MLLTNTNPPWWWDYQYTLISGLENVSQDLSCELGYLFCAVPPSQEEMG